MVPGAITTVDLLTAVSSNCREGSRAGQDSGHVAAESGGSNGARRQRRRLARTALASAYFVPDVHGSTV